MINITKPELTAPKIVCDMDTLTKCCGERIARVTSNTTKITITLENFTQVTVKVDRGNAEYCDITWNTEHPFGKLIEIQAQEYAHRERHDRIPMCFITSEGKFFCEIYLAYPDGNHPETTVTIKLEDNTNEF